jgi:hypothetical protein
MRKNKKWIGREWPTMIKGEVGKRERDICRKNEKELEREKRGKPWTNVERVKKKKGEDDNVIE